MEPDTGKPKNITSCEMMGGGWRGQMENVSLASAETRLSRGRSPTLRYLKSLFQH